MYLNAEYCIQLDSYIPSNRDEQHYFDDNDEHFPVSAECSDFKKVNENKLRWEKIFLLAIHKCCTQIFEGAQNRNTERNDTKRKNVGCVF